MRKNNTALTGKEIIRMASAMGWTTVSSNRGCGEETVIFQFGKKTAEMENTANALNNLLALAEKNAYTPLGDKLSELYFNLLEKAG